MKPLVFITLFFALFSCTKKDAAAEDHELPTVVINNPVNGQVFSGSQTITIGATLSDNTRLVEVHVHISNSSTGALLADIHRNPAAPTYALSETFAVQAGTQYKIQVIAKDKAANEGRASVEINVN